MYHFSVIRDHVTVVWDFFFHPSLLWGGWWSGEGDSVHALYFSPPPRDTEWHSARASELNSCTQSEEDSPSRTNMIHIQTID